MFGAPPGLRAWQERLLEGREQADLGASSSLWGLAKEQLPGTILGMPPTGDRGKLLGSRCLSFLSCTMGIFELRIEQRVLNTNKYPGQVTK